MQPCKIEFDAPVTLSGKEVASVTLRRPVVADAIAIQDAQKAGRDVEVLVVLISRLSGLSRDDVEQIPVDQLPKFEGAMNRFFPDAAKAAQTPISEKSS
jgi:hypothetical protein